MAYFLSGRDTCAFILLIGSGSLKPRLPRTAPQQPYSGSQSGHVWRQMESESVSGLPEMSLTSAAHKESGHRRSGITRWKKSKKKKRGVSKKPSSTFTSLTQRWKRAEQQARKAKETGQAVQGGMEFKQHDLDADVFFSFFFFNSHLTPVSLFFKNHKNILLIQCTWFN